MTSLLAVILLVDIHPQTRPSNSFSTAFAVYNNGGGHQSHRSTPRLHIILPTININASSSFRAQNSVASYLRYKRRDVTITFPE
ncbi:hypothetical protein EAE96_008288 [Botrytis aclada]|nr:hypothetical protein EAE96_008288 [Botrytis aclada]